MPDSEEVDWGEWMRALGRQGRRIRELLNLSQEELARMAGVSQGAVSRLEAGRGLATPMLVVLKISLALARRLKTVDPKLLADDVRNILDLEEHLYPPLPGFRAEPPRILKDPDLEALLELYRRTPERQRVTLLSVMRATAEALAAASSAGGGGADEKS